MGANLSLPLGYWLPTQDPWGWAPCGSTGAPLLLQVGAEACGMGIAAGYTPPVEESFLLIFTSTRDYSLAV